MNLTRLKKEEGTTLIELLVYLGMLTFILYGVYTMYEASEALYVSASSQAEAQGTGRIAQASVVKHLRMTESFAEAGDYSVDIRADINDDNLWDKVKYYSVDGRLYRNINDGQDRLIVSGIRNQVLGTPIFIYYDIHGVAMTTDTASRITKTHQIGINLIIDNEPSRPPEAYVLSNKVTLRNSE